MKQREKLQEKISDWFVLILGIILMGVQAYEYITGQIEGSVVEIGVFVIGFLLARYPSGLTDIVRNIASIFYNRMDK
jgi:uncharacterized membrane protein